VRRAPEEDPPSLVGLGGLEVTDVEEHLVNIPVVRI